MEEEPMNPAYNVLSISSTGGQSQMRHDTIGPISVCVWCASDRKKGVMSGYRRLLPTTIYLDLFKLRLVQILLQGLR